VEIFLLMIQANINPDEIMIRGISLIIIGRMKICVVRNVIHLIDLPATIDINPSNIVGPIILVSSLILRNELAKFGPHRTIILNRAE
jgi:hypothetical protein